jgi:signal transduction histidine kinase
MYGGLEATRRLSVRLYGPDRREIGRVRAPQSEATSASEPLTGPFEQFSVRVSPTESAPVVWTGRFVALEMAFIALMVLVILGATVFGLRYTIRQLELAQIKSSFVSNVSHELKTPVALIRLAVETLEMGRVTTPEDREKFLRTISRETMRLSQLVENILDFARLEAGQRVFRFERVDVLDLVREALEGFRIRLEDQGFAVSVDLPESLPVVRADPTALTHCLLNLLDNAIKYSRQRREIRVSAEARDGLVGVSVTDRGIGISPADQRRIFEKFVRVETGLVHDVKGAGLGLSLVDQIMRAHGGRVEVSSVVGEGSTFTLLIPVAAEAAGEADEPRRKTGS